LFGSNLLVATSGENDSGTLKGVWKVSPHATNGSATFLANIDTAHLEGLLALPNDPNKFGPWAGKILTGDKEAPTPIIFSIDPSGIVVTNYTTNFVQDGINPEHFDIIPTNQDLYACAEAAGKIVKLPAIYLSNFVGDLLVTDGGEYNLSRTASCSIFHWNSTHTNFVVHTLWFQDTNNYSRFENVTFAPIVLPKL
jgi:hypothetical protein